MRRLAFSSNAFKKNTLAEAVESIADAGYTGVELMADVPHAHPLKFSTDDRAAVKSLLKRRGLAVSNVNAFTHFADGDTYHPTWIEPDADRRRIRIEHTKRAVELAAEFGAGSVSLQPGGPTIGMAVTRDQAGRRFAGGLAEVIQVAKTHGVVLAIEPEPGLFIETAAEYAAFKSEFFPAESAIAMNCDVGHLFCVGDDPATVIRDQPTQIAHVHLEDIGANRVHQHLTPGRGVIDFPAIFAALDAIKYSGWVTVELYPYETTAAGVAVRAYEHLRPMV
jgi:sugar phosphate isomerase/epimerase